MTAKSKQFLGGEQSFSIIEEYATLSPNRKTLLCDNLCLESHGRFQNMVKSIWPDASDYDLKKLEKFLNLVRVSSH